MNYILIYYPNCIWCQLYNSLNIFRFIQKGLTLDLPNAYFRLTK
jgi:hypothetical protein